MMRATGALRGAATGDRADVLGLALGCLALTVATAGLYSFQARTRLRRRVWGSLWLGGAPLEYTGRAWEKAAGFAIAALIVALYLGAGVMLLIFASLELTADTRWGTAAAFALLVPLWHFATYRGQRYLMSRTRWRGLAFGLEPGAWGFAWRGTLWALAVIPSLGLLMPARARALWRYRADRARWGNAPIRSDTQLAPLWAAWAPMQAGLLLALGSGVAAWDGAGPADGAQAAVGIAVLALPLLMPLWLFWRVRSTRHLVSALRLGDAALAVSPRYWRIAGIHLGGWLLVLAALGAAVIVTLVAGVAGAAANLDVAALGTLPVWTLAALGVAAYVTIFLLRGALRLALVTVPTLRHVAGTALLSDARAPDGVRRGPGDDVADADGFANLFDFGSAL